MIQKRFAMNPLEALSGKENVDKVNKDAVEKDRNAVLASRVNDMGPEAQKPVLDASPDGKAKLAALASSPQLQALETLMEDPANLA